MIGDNKAAVHWVNKCGGKRDSRAGGLMTFLGALELKAGWNHVATHVAGLDSVAADAIARWAPHSIDNGLCQRFQTVSWQEKELDAESSRVCATFLRSYSGF